MLSFNKLERRLRVCQLLLEFGTGQYCIVTCQKTVDIYNLL